MHRGFSGATVEYLGMSVVKKCTGPAARRLLDSMDKQQWLRGVVDGVARVPEFECGAWGPDFCTVTMERAPGIRLEEWVFDADEAALQRMGERLADIVVCLGNADPFEPPVQSITEMILSKLEVLRTAPGVSTASRDEACELLDQLHEQVWVCEATGCHGDLAFDNILVDGDDLWLLDPLPQPFDHWMWDVAKEMQSTRIDWPSIRSGAIRSGLMLSRHPRLDVLSTAFHVRISETMGSDEGDPHVMLFLATTLARIIPYAPTQPQVQALHDLALWLLRSRQWCA